MTDTPTLTAEQREPCAQCHVRPGTEVWSESMLAYTHGMFERICLICSLDRQIAFAEELAAKLPEWKAQRAELLARAPAETE